ncbi:coiled-coil domain-containing 92B-like [Nerophis lumbriciformis]|uniref:coiled-coil domain-containing 92B-like n=1 Tax=Nerophis lumbriciformis TaxID=546530 RepID=UPI002AE082EC|nr:coiled-coil domain-containing 92B-like [Nerophis lumbriciformis]
MDAGRLEQHVASVRRGIVFLEQEHVTLLAGLHVEIAHLKRRCHELSCELDSRFPDRTTTEKEAELAARCQAAQRLLEERQCMMVGARGELRLGRARASELGRSLREEERHFLEELKRRSHKITLLSRELQRQNAATSALCHQLHAARAKLEQQRGYVAGAAQEDEGREEEGEAADWLLTPPPPASPGHPAARRAVREARVRACVPQERVTSPQRPHPMPDPALFLVPFRFRLLRWSRPIRLQDAEDDWEDVDEDGLHGRVDMGTAEGETAL